MTRILGISGSLRAGSFNTALLRAARDLTADQVELDIATLHGIPLYDADLEQRKGLPPAVLELKAKIMASDGVMLATPEYNNGIPGVFKNGIDWLSRPPAEIPKIFRRPFVIMGASPGGFGTILSQAAWLPVLRSLGAPVWSGGRLMVSRASQVFDAHGAVADEATREQLRKFTLGFAAFVAEQGSK